MTNDKNNITQIAFRKVIQNKKLTDEEAIALENSWQENSRFRKVSIRILKSWYTYAITLISGALFAYFSDLFNAVD